MYETNEETFIRLIWAAHALFIDFHCFFFSLSCYVGLYIHIVTAERVNWNEKNEVKLEIYIVSFFLHFGALPVCVCFFLIILHKYLFSTWFLCTVCVHLSFLWMPHFLFFNFFFIFILFSHCSLFIVTSYCVSVLSFQCQQYGWFVKKLS